MWTPNRSSRQSCPATSARPLGVYSTTPRNTKGARITSRIAAMSRRRRISELGRDVEVDARAATGFRQRLRDVHAEGGDRDVVAHAEAGRVLELRVGEVVERVADVVKRGDAEVARQVARHLDRAGRQVLAADAVAVLVARRKLVELEAAHAAVAAGEEALRGGQVENLVVAARVDAGRAELGAQAKMPALREIEDALALEAQLHERGVGTERGRRAAQLEVQPIRPRLAADDVAGHRRVADAREHVEGGIARAVALGRGLVR